MSRQPKVAAIVVTYNRKRFLVRCLDSIIRQSFKINSIYIIDNASTDGTYECLSATGLLSDANVVYHRLDRNTGGAGGFSFGLRRAYEDGHEWFWLMDDDVLAFNDTLERLIELRNISECIHPLRFWKDGTEVSWEQWIDINTLCITNLKNRSFQYGKNVTFVNVGCFEGMLISRSIVEKIGFPDDKYFICNDDTLYGLKATLYTNVIFTNLSKMQRQVPKSNNYKKTKVNLYYSIRNNFYLHRDIQEYFFSKTSIRIKLLFILNQFIFLLGLFRKYPMHIFILLKAFYRGILYWAFGKKSKNDLF